MAFKHISLGAETSQGMFKQICQDI